MITATYVVELEDGSKIEITAKGPTIVELAAKIEREARTLVTQKVTKKYIKCVLYH